jgi:pilus assembly protein CpaC
MRGMTRRWLLAAAVALCCIGGGGAFAQSLEEPSTQPIIVRDTGVRIDASLGLNKSRIVRLPVDVRDVLVTSPDVADIVMKTPRIAYVLGQSIGDTNVLFLDAEGEEIASIDLRVELDLSVLERTIETLIPNESIEVTSANQNVILTGTVTSAEVAESAQLVARRFVKADDQIVNLLAVRTKSQVLLKVKIAEVQRQVLKQFGFDLAANVHANNVNFTLFTDTPDSLDATSFASGVNFLQGGDAAFRQLAALFENLERDGVVKTLAEPSVTAISGELAKILVGGEFPVPVAQQNDTITIEFKEFGIALNFTPVVLASDRISLQVSTEVSELSTEGQITLADIVIPALAVRRASTTVNLPSGGSLVIGGLLQNDIRNTVDGFPGLKDIPVLGALFRSVNFRRDESELIITVTPYLVRPVAEQAFTLPTDGFPPVSDVDLYLFGRLHGVTDKPESSGEPETSISGPIGYILE